MCKVRLGCRDRRSAQPSRSVLFGRRFFLVCWYFVYRTDTTKPHRAVSPTSRTITRVCSHVGPGDDKSLDLTGAEIRAETVDEQGHTEHDEMPLWGRGKQ